MGWSYMEVSKREASTVGTLVRVIHQKGSTYEFAFRVNGVPVRDDSGDCKTALTPSGCIEGATVVVYYDPERVTGALLQEFGAAGREKIFFGALMAFGGFLLIGLYFIFQKVKASPMTDQRPFMLSLASECRPILSVPK